MNPSLASTYLTRVGTEQYEFDQGRYEQLCTFLGQIQNLLRQVWICLRLLCGSIDFTQRSIKYCLNSMYWYLVVHSSVGHLLHLALVFIPEFYYEFPFWKQSKHYILRILLLPPVIEQNKKVISSRNSRKIIMAVKASGED